MRKILALTIPLYRLRRKLRRETNAVRLAD